MARRGWTLPLGGAARRAGRSPWSRSALDEAGGPLLDEDVLRQLQRFSLISGSALTDWLLGEHAGRRKTQAIEFADYRGYVPGDDLRLIDWNAYARLGELFVKTSQTEEVITLSVLLDCSRSMDWGHPNKLRYSKRLAALLGALALLQSDGVRIIALGDGTALQGQPLYGPAALQTLAGELETLPVAGTTDLRGSLYATQQQLDLHGAVVMISDFLVPADQDGALSALAAEGTTATVLHIVDPAEALPDAGGAMALRDRESGEQLLLTVTPALRRRYSERFNARAAALSDSCASLGMRYVRVGTDLAPFDVLMQTLREDGAERG